jgi:hypothetical protein
MTSEAFDLEVSHSQITVFPSKLDKPINAWTQRHSDQGFAWRPGSVSFGTVEGSGTHSVEVAIVDHAGDVSAEAIRVIEVPFEVPADDVIEVGSVPGEVHVTVPPGSYLLRCEFLPPTGEEYEGSIRLMFARKDTPRFAVVRADEEIIIGDDGLLTTAEPVPDPD